MVLPFPTMADYAVIDMGDHLVYLTHGHLASPDKLPPLTPGDVFISGHTHIPIDEMHGGIRCLNPGSVSIPKGGSGHAALIMDGKEFKRIQL
jgi:predicted phosphodiesterase